MDTPPRIRVVDPDNSVFKLEARFGAGTEFSKFADRAGCVVSRRVVGLFLREYTVRGTEAQLQRFVDLMWCDSSPLGQQFRNEVRRAAMT